MSARSSHHGITCVSPFTCLKSNSNNRKQNETTKRMLAIWTTVLRLAHQTVSWLSCLSSSALMPNKAGPELLPPACGLSFWTDSIFQCSRNTCTNFFTAALHSAPLREGECGPKFGEAAGNQPRASSARFLPATRKQTSFCFFSWSDIFPGPVAVISTRSRVGVNCFCRGGGDRLRGGRCRQSGVPGLRRRLVFLWVSPTALPDQQVILYQSPISVLFLPPFIPPPSSLFYHGYFLWLVFVLFLKAVLTLLLFLKFSSLFFSRHLFISIFSVCLWFQLRIHTFFFLAFGCPFLT